MNINVHIERLILDGVPIAHRERPMLQGAVEAELVRLLAIDGLASHLLASGGMPRLQGGNIQLASEGDTGQLGQQIAQSLSIHRGGDQ